MSIVHNMRTLLPVLLGALAAIGCFAQPYCRVKTFSLAQRITTNHITHFEQDADGMLWISSINGLWSFDGYEFMPRHDSGDFHTVTTQRYLSLRHNHSGGMYLADNRRQLYLYSERDGKFCSISKILAAKGIDMKVLDIMTLENGHTWLVGVRGSSPGLVRIDDNRILSGEGIEIVCKEPLRDATYRAMICSDGSEIIYGKIGVYTPGRGKIYGGKVMTCIPFGKSLLWGGEGNSMTLYDPRTKKQTPFAMPTGVDNVNNLTAIDNRRVVCGTNKGLAVIDVPLRRVSLVSLKNPSSPSNQVTNIYLDSSKRLWVFTESDGVTLLQPGLKNPRWLMARVGDENTGTTADFTVWLEDRHRTVWTIPRGGTFCYYDEGEGRLVAQPVYEQENRRFAIPKMQRTFVDAQKNLWFTGPHSFNMLSFGKYDTREITCDYLGEVRATLVDRKGDIWTGSEAGHLIVHSPDNRPKGYVTAGGRVSAGPAVFAPKIYSLFEDSKGRKWIGTRDNGVYVLAPGGKVENYRHTDGDPFSLSNNRVNCMMEDGKGRIWIGTYKGGLNLVDESGPKLKFLNSGNVLGKSPLAADCGIRRMTRTRDGVILLSTTQGLIMLSENFKSPRDITYHHFAASADTAASAGNSHYDVIQTVVTRSGRIFAATLSGDLFEIDAKTLLSQPRTKTEFNRNVFDGTINGMFEDRKGNLWVVHENNLDCYDPQTGKLFTEWSNQLPNYCDFTEAQPSVSPVDGIAVIGTQNGYVTFNPLGIKPSTNIPKIVFTSVLLNGDKELTPILGRDRIDLPPDKHSFTVSFAALDYAENMFIKYSYRLEGVDKDWNNIGYDHRVSFNDLPAGTYRLLVRSTNSDGVEVDNVAAITIRATPAWYETWLAKLFYLVIAGGILYLIYIYNKTRHVAEMEKILSERKTLLYREASHKLRTPLTLIGGPIVEVLKSTRLTDSEREYLETARSNSQNMLKLVDGMLSDNMSGSYFVDDKNAPVFAAEDSGGDFEDGDDETQEQNRDKTRILVVEDNPDLRKFLVALLSPTYTVMTAANGKEGLESAVANQPDFILSDVTMPVMDGLTMVGLIKKNPEICHIPIIILSARASIDDKVQGMEQGIDDYITKPFSARYLKQRMAEVIAHRRVEEQASVEEIMQKKDGGYRLSSVKIVDYDREMMSRLMDYLEEHICEADLRVEDMAVAVNLGRTVFFTKLKSIVGMSPTDFLRSLRVKRASEMLAKSKLTVAEISIAVGFSDQRYFSRVFKKEMGVTPTEYRAAEQRC